MSLSPLLRSRIRNAMHWSFFFELTTAPLIGLAIIVYGVLGFFDIVATSPFTPGLLLLFGVVFFVGSIFALRIAWKQLRDE